MNKLQISNEAHFRDAARRAIFSIILFVISYILLIALSIVLVIACALCGIAVMSLKMSGITIGFGIGIMALGVIIFIFLIKFIFKKHIVDRSHLVELEESDAPLLYEEIRLIVDQVKTTFPKKIYLSHEVNAAVFYDSTFLSMFFPIQKNLQIGLGLINSCTKQELKVVLAHEFGHFSQQSMKVGSYVYTVNQIIFNMLFDNEDYNRKVKGFGDISGYFFIFTAIGLKITEGIQWLLKSLYEEVNKSHMGLSRQMEFHADAIAAKIMGTQAFISSLMRLDLANGAYQTVIGYYDDKIAECIKPKNIYPQHLFVIDLMAKQADIAIVNGFPDVSEEELNRYHKSKLVIDDQWASHPSTKDRIAAVKSYQFDEGETDSLPANSFFTNITELQEMVTEVLFAKVNYKGLPVDDDSNQFRETILKIGKETKFPNLFDGYYDLHNPVTIDLDESTVTEISSTFGSLFSKEKISLVLTISALKNDIGILKQLNEGNGTIKSFEYDGIKYGLSSILDLLIHLQHESDQLQSQIVLNDIAIYHYFKQKALVVHSDALLKEKYQKYITFDNVYDFGFGLYLKIVNALQFIQQTKQIELIRTNFEAFEPLEKELKEQIQILIAMPEYSINDLQRSDLELYLIDDLDYFIAPAYQDYSLRVLYAALSAYQEVLNENYLLYKLDFLTMLSALEVGNVSTLFQRQKDHSVEGH